MTTNKDRMSINQEPRADRLIYVDELAEMIRRSPAAVRFAVLRGEAPPSALISGRRMFRESDVVAWIDEQVEAAK